MYLLHLKPGTLSLDEAQSPADTHSRQIMELLKAADERGEFIPPLASRGSTSDSDLKPRKRLEITEDALTPYFSSLIGQHTICVLDADRIAAFMSFKIVKADDELYKVFEDECAYVSTVIVDRSYRGLRLTYDMYYELFEFARSEALCVGTRTWSTNHAHLSILDKLGFERPRVIPDDRGQDIDTVYLKKTLRAETFSFLKRLRAYHAFDSLAGGIALLVLTLIFVLLYVYADLEIAGEIWLAFATSSLASAIFLVVDSINRYRANRSEDYLIEMREFGIESLSFQKPMLLIDKINQAQSRVWISGYRHILNASIANAILKAAARGVEIRILSTPPWSDAYELVYGSPASNRRIPRKTRADGVDPQH